ncbi:MobH family relaxase [Halomonas colorata]|nr:MobH family relaxase [Halomonas colorata]
MLKSLFIKKKMAPIPRSRAEEGWVVPLAGAKLLDQPYRKQVIKALWDLTSLTKPVFQEFIQRPLERYAELVQLIPASESHHHAYAGGMLDHGLEVVNFALRIRQKHLLPPGASPEMQSSCSERWTVAIAYGALLHDVAKLLDVDIYLNDGRKWCVWNGPIPSPYRVKYRKDRDYMLHQATNGLLCHRVLDGAILDWVSEDPQVFKQLMFSMSGYSSEAGIIGEIVSQADRASVANALGGDPAKALKAPVQSLQRKLTDALRYLVKEQLTLNAPRAPAYLTDDALWIVSPSVPNQLKAYLLEHGVGGVPSNTTRMYDEMQAHGLIEEAGEGKSVWKADVQIGDWRASLSFLKVPAGLIWGAEEERPSTLNGTLTVIDSKASKDSSSTALDSAAAAKPKLAESSEAIADTEIHSSASEAGEFSINDMMALIAGDDVQADEVSTTKKQSNEAFCNVSKSPQADPVDIGERFISWLQQSLASRKLIVNDSKALVHVVEGGYFLVSPGIFRRFCDLTFGTDKNWNKVQQRFQKLGLHIKTEHDTNIWEVSVRGPNRRGSVLKGYRLKQDSDITPTDCMDNVFLTLAQEEGE